MVEEEIDFVADVVAPEVKVGGAPGVVALLEGFENDVVFEESTAQEMGFELSRGFDAEQAGGDAGIGEVELMLLHEPLAEVLMVGGEAEYDVAGFEDI